MKPPIPYRGAAQASQSLPFGWSVAGLISGNKPGHFFNAVARSSAGDLIATGDDEGAVRLYRCPMGAADNKCARVCVYVSGVCTSVCVCVVCDTSLLHCTEPLSRVKDRLFDIFPDDFSKLVMC